MTLLHCAEVTTRFERGDEEVGALDGVSLDVDDGEFVALVGRSGSGKSTLLHLAGGLDRPDAGTVHLDGRDLATLSVGDRAQLRRREIGFVFQFFHLIPTLSVRENVALPLLLDGASGNGRVDDLLERVGVSHRRDHLPGELSGGELQRAAVARSLVACPRLVLADEPTGNLDSHNGEVILELLLEQVAHAGAALLLVTHDADAAARATRRHLLRDGHLEPA